MSSNYLKKQEAVPMIYRRHGDTQPGMKSHALARTPSSSGALARRLSNTLPDNNEAAIYLPTSVPSPSNEPFVPSFSKADRMVLKFDAYFMEAVHESAVENYRVRICDLLYYLEDHSIQIVEPKVENSGMTQGNFVKRHRIVAAQQNDDATQASTSPKSSKSKSKSKSSTSTDELSYISYQDLNIGQDITIYGRTFHVFDMDKYTREYLTKQGIRIPPTESPPSDPYTLHTKKAKAKNTPPSQADSATQYVEALLGKFIRPSDHLRRFLEHNRHVLRWYAQWDDTSSAYGLKHNYTIHYFLQDNTVEIRENYARNAGCDAFPKMLNQVRLLKNVNIPRERATDKDFYSWEDFQLGKKVHIYGRDILLIGADASTKAFFKEKGVPLGHEVDVSEPVKVFPKFIAPPHQSGIGSEEDSLGNCFNLIPKLPRRNWEQLKETQILRFSAYMKTKKPEDVGRTFIVSFFLKDEHVKIVEEVKRNSGIWGGKFLEKGLHKTSDGKKLVKTDFYLGAHLNIFGHAFILDGVDENTATYMELEQATFAFADVNLVRNKLIQKIRNHWDANMQKSMEALEQMSVAANGLGFYEIKHFLGTYFPEIKDHEIFTWMRSFQNRKNTSSTSMSTSTSLSEGKNNDDGGDDDDGDDKQENVSNESSTQQVSFDDLVTDLSIHQYVASARKGSGFQDALTPALTHGSERERGRGRGSDAIDITKRVSEAITEHKDEALRIFRLNDHGLTSQADRVQFVKCLSKIYPGPPSDLETAAQVLYNKSAHVNYMECLDKMESIALK